MEVHQKNKNITIIRSSDSTPGYISEENENITTKNICTPMFTAAFFTIAKIRKQPKFLSTGEWIKKMWCTHKHTHTHTHTQKNITQP